MLYSVVWKGNLLNREFSFYCKPDTRHECTCVICTLITLWSYYTLCIARQTYRGGPTTPCNYFTSLYEKNGFAEI